MDLFLEQRNSARNKRIVRHGSPTNNLVLSAYQAPNERVFPKILDLYVSPGSVIADITYGKGVFWRNIAADRYRLLASDLADGVDCRNLPYEDAEMDCVVFDPPYMHSPGGTAHSTHTPFENYYRNNRTGNTTEPRIPPTRRSRTITAITARETPRRASTTKRCWSCMPIPAERPTVSSVTVE